LIAIGGGLLATGAFAWLFPKAMQKYKRYKAYRIVRDYRDRVFPYILEIPKKLGEVENMTGKKLAVDEIKNYFKTEDTLAFRQIEKACDDICDKHSITSAEFKEICDKSYKDDLEIQEMIHEVRTTLD